MFKSIGTNNIIRSGAVFSRSENIIVGSNNMIDDFVLISGGKDKLTIIGDHVHIAVFCSVLGSEGVIFEDFSNASPGSRVFSSTDDYVCGYLINPTVPDECRKETKGTVIFGKYTCVGANCVILPGVTIGEGATVGACSLVTKDIEPWTINVGVPTRVIGIRDKINLFTQLDKMRKDG